MRALAGAGFWGTGRVATHSGLGWMGGLVLRMVLAFKVADGETGSTFSQAPDYKSTQTIQNQNQYLRPEEEPH